MAQANVYLQRRFSLKSAADSAYRDGLQQMTLERSVSSGLRASLDQTISLTSGQAALTINLGDARSLRHLLVTADQAVNLVWNGNSSVRCGLTSAVAAMTYLEGSITSLTVRNVVPSAATAVRLKGYGPTAT